MQLESHRPAVLADLPTGEPGTATTLRMMRSYVQQFKKSPEVRDTALALIAPLPQKDWVGEVRIVFEWVRDHIRYVRDVHGVETLQTPVATMDLGAGDCDDKSTLLAALLESIGHPTRFVAAGYRELHRYSHVYVETLLGTRWVPLDATLVDKPMGSIPREPVARLVVHN